MASHPQALQSCTDPCQTLALEDSSPSTCEVPAKLQISLGLSFVCTPGARPVAGAGAQPSRICRWLKGGGLHEGHTAAIRAGL